MFSIIVPVYNVKSYLSECINSVLSQDYQNFELILVNDGSSDGSDIICDQYALLDNRITVIHQQNQGLSVARNTGINIACGDYIIFLDSDDYWLTNDLLSQFYSRISIKNVDVISFNFAKVRNGTFNNPYFSEKSMPEELKGNDSLKYLTDRNLWIACAWNKVIRRSLFEKYDLEFISGITAEDIDWCMRLAINAENFDYISDVLVAYRQRNNSITKNITIDKIQILIYNIENSYLILTDSQQQVKSIFLKSYLGYVFATSFFAISSLEFYSIKKYFIDFLKNRKKMLFWSNHRKVRIIRILINIFGVKLTVFLIHFAMVLLRR